ncbi:MAG: hypothetical protein E7576_01105 [Ruminococcaceae bacterium]|jgi:fibro-slime domain-containing protein|nr:hypothetical protein [Oscillospiraceae bacterium]
MKKTIYLRAIAFLLALSITLGISAPTGAILIAVTTVQEVPNSVLTAEGEDWKVKAALDRRDEWPEELELRAEEVDGEEYLRALAAERVEYARFFDISIWSGESEVQPEGRSVKVEITVPELEEDVDEIRVVHFTEPEADETALPEAVEDDLFLPQDVLTGYRSMAEEGNEADFSSVEDEAFPAEEETRALLPEAIEYTVIEQDGQKILSFVADGFSVYGVIGTTIEKTVLASDGNMYRITAAFGPETGIPEDAELNVAEILPEDDFYSLYLEDSLAALGWEDRDVSYSRLFDISLQTADGLLVEPAEGTFVKVDIELADKDAAITPQVVHFGEEVVVLSSETEGEVVRFETDGFSVYAIVDAPEPYNCIEENIAYYLSYGNSPLYVKNSLNNKNCFIESNNVADAAEWYFERVDGTNDQYYIYTFINNAKKYMKQKQQNGNDMELTESVGTAFIVSDGGKNDTFYIKHASEDRWLQHSKGGGGVRLYQANNDIENCSFTLTNVATGIPVTSPDDYLELDGKTYGIAYHNDKAAAAALSSNSKDNKHLAAQELLMQPDVLTNSGILFVAKDSDITEWTFHNVEKNKYIISVETADGMRFLSLNNDKLELSSTEITASTFTVSAGVGENIGKYQFSVGEYKLCVDLDGEKTDKGFFGSKNAAWLNLVQKSTLTDDDFVEYSARKISASDEILSETEPERPKVIIYTRVWNETTKKYEYYAVDHDGSLVRVYDSGDMINWVGNQVNSALWEFTEYTNNDGTPSYFYELENTAYSGTYLVPQSEGIIARQPVGINMNGRRDGFDYTSIVAWDDAAYAYSGLKVVRDEKGVLRTVTCSLDDASDFYFAVIAPHVEEADPVTTVETVDNNEFGISIKMIDFNNTLWNERDPVQNGFFLPRENHWKDWNQYNPTQGLLSTNLTDGYPIATDKTQKEGHSFSELFNNMTEANHLFIQSVYNESGYFEYDSTQNFAHLITDENDYWCDSSRGNYEVGDYVVYNQLGAIGSVVSETRAHGQFMPYNDISAEVGYARTAYDGTGEVIVNTTDVNRAELPDTDPRKGEPLYAIPQNNNQAREIKNLMGLAETPKPADYFFGMELSASFTQTPNGLDNWGHDIIFEFTGDDDFWFYVDGELVIDLGGIHSALPGSVNFRTGEVNVNGTWTTLKTLFRENYIARGHTDAEADSYVDGENGIFEQKFDDDGNPLKDTHGNDVYTFKNYSTHNMKMFYMERGSGASNLKMRFNLASVKPGTVELSKNLKGADSKSNKLIQYPYQIWYQTAEYAQNEDGTYQLDGNGNRIIESYNNPILLSQPASNANLTGQVYAVYKGTKTLIPYKGSMSIGGIPYNNVFLLKAGETAVVNFPENTYRYKIVECGVDTSVYEHVYINGDESGNEIFGKPYNNSDGWDSTTEPETMPAFTTTYDGTSRSDFGVTYDTTEGRPRVEYTNEVPPEVMRTLSFEKVLYDSSGNRLADEQAANVKSVFSFRLYLGNEFANEENLLPADMYTYYVKGPDGRYCKWDKEDQKFVSLGVGTFEEFKSLPKADQHAGTFTTSMYGSISKIPAGYTVEVRDLIVGTKYKVEEPDREIPKGFTRRDGDGYVRTDLPEGAVVYYTTGETYGHHPAEGNIITAEPISDTIVSKTESPEIEIRNQEGWGLTAKKVWTDKDFMTHDPIYLAVYLRKGEEPNYTYTLLPDKVRQLTNSDTEAYYFFSDLKVDGEPYRFDQFVVREVKLVISDGHTLEVDSDGKVTVDDHVTVNPISHGMPIVIGGVPIGGSHREETYTVSYETGDSTGQNENIRNDTVKNSRPGIQIYKTDWSGEHYLSGAVFTLKDAEGQDVGAASYTSDSEGYVTTAYLSEGTFTLNETKTPTGYVALDEPITLTVTTTEPRSYDLSVTEGSVTYYITLSGPTGSYTTANATPTDMARITVKNRTAQGLKVVKVGVADGTRPLLVGVHFALYDQVKDSEGNYRPNYNPKVGYEDLETNDNGMLEEITMGLGAGTYYLREKEAPDGYKKLADDLCFTIGEDGKVTINTAAYSGWLKTNASAAGEIGYEIEVENMPLGISIKKTDEKGVNLTGSKFQLCMLNENDAWAVVGEYGLNQGLIDLTDKSVHTFAGMRNGRYRLKETVAPDGYIILSSETYFKVEDGVVVLTDAYGDQTEYEYSYLEDDSTTIVIKNHPGASLPSTGGCTAIPFLITGSILTTTATALSLRELRRRRKEQES